MCNLTFIILSQNEWDMVWSVEYGSPPYYGVDMRVVGNPNTTTDYCHNGGLCSDNSISIDNAGNIIAIAAWGGGSANTISGIRVFKLDSSDGSTIWTRDFNDSWDQTPSDILIDKTGNYVVLYRVDVGNSDHSWGGRIYRLSPDGSTICRTNFFHSGGWHNYEDGAYGLAIDNSNDIIVASAEAGSFLLRKFSPSCSSLWTINIDAAGYPYVSGGRDVEVDRDGNYITVGYETRNNMMIVAKVDPNGNLLWKNYYTQSYGGNGRHVVSDAEIAVDSSNNYVIATQDGKVIKMDTNGNILWVRSFSSIDLDGIAIPASESNYLIVGTFYESGDRDVFVAKIRASDGSTVWSRTFDNVSAPTDQTGGDIGTGITLLPDGSIIVSGYRGNKNYGGHIWIFKLVGLTPVHREEERHTGFQIRRIYTPDGRYISPQESSLRSGLYILEEISSGGKVRRRPIVVP